MQYNWIVIKMPYRVDRLAAGGGEFGKRFLRKEMGFRMSVPCALFQLVKSVWFSYDSTADGEVHMMVLPQLPDLTQ